MSVLKSRADKQVAAHQETAIGKITAKYTDANGYTVYDVQIDDTTLRGVPCPQQESYSVGTSVLVGYIGGYRHVPQILGVAIDERSSIVNTNIPQMFELPEEVVTAVGEVRGYELLFSENFSGGKAANTFTYWTGSWSIDYVDEYHNFALKQTDASVEYARAYFGEKFWKDYTVWLNFKVDEFGDGDSALIIAIRCFDKSMSGTCKQYELWIKSNIIQLFRNDGGSRTELDSSVQTIEADFWHSIQIKALEESFVVSLDGTELFTTQDSATYFKSGSLALITHYAKVTVDEIFVWRGYTDALDGQLTGSAPPNVTGLEIFGQGNDTTFRGRDCKFVWKRTAATSGAAVEPAGEEYQDAGAGAEDRWARDYLVEIWVSGTLVRTEYVKENSYVYTYEKNVEDNGTPASTFTIKVWARNSYNMLSERPATLTVTNGPPTMTEVFADFGGRNCILTWTDCGDLDFDHYLVKVYNSAGDRDTDVNPVREVSVKDCSFVYTLEMNTEDFGTPRAQLYFRVFAVDAMGQTDSVTVDAENPLETMTSVATNFERADCILSWSLIGADTDYFKIKVYPTLSDAENDTNAVRAEKVNATTFTYSLAMNKQDFRTPKTTLYFRVFVVDVFGREDSKMVTATSAPVYVGAVHSSFQDPNCKLWWDPPSRPIVDHYEIKVYGSVSDRDADTNVKRTERTSANAFVYMYAMNLADFDTPTPDLYFRIKLVDVFERTDEVLTEAHNAKPEAPAAPTVTPFFSKLSITWTLLDEPDIIGYNVYIDDVKVAFVQSNNFVYEAEPNTEYRVRVSASDNFQEGPKSPEVTATTFSLRLQDYSLEIPLMKDITWTEHSPTTVSVSWSSGYLAYKGKVYEISSGSTSEKYIYWELGNPTQFQTSDTKPAIGMDSFLIAVNDAGALFLATQNKIQHAGVLQAGSITAEELATENLITNSAQIAEGVIQDAHIQSLSGDKITANTITADRFVDTLYGNLNQAVRFTKTVLRDVPGDWEHALTQSDIAGGTYSGIDIGPHTDYYPSLRLDMTRHWDDGSAWWDQSGVYWDHPVVAGGTWTSLSFDSGTEASRVLDVFPHLVKDSPDATFGAQAIYSKDGVNWGSNADCNDNNWETLTQTTAIEGTEVEEAWEGSVLSFRYFKVRFILQTSDASKRIIVNQPNLVLSSIDIAVASEPEVDSKIEAHKSDPDAHHPQFHASDHGPGGSDALPWGSGGGLDVDMVDGIHASTTGEAGKLIRADEVDSKVLTHREVAPDGYTESAYGKKIFRITTSSSSVTKDLLQVYAADDFNGGWNVEVRVLNGHMYDAVFSELLITGLKHSNAPSWTIVGTAQTTLLSIGTVHASSLAWVQIDANHYKLQLTINETYAVSFVEVKITQRRSGGTAPSFSFYD